MTALKLSRGLMVGTLSLLAACTQTPYRAPVAPQPPSAISIVNLESLPQTIGLEHQDRVNRFNRLATLNGVNPPQIDQLQLAPGQVPGFDYPIPVVRVVFDEKVFFDFNKDTVRPEAQPVLDVIAQNMKRDVPDAKLMVLGHTDSVGGDAFNDRLSMRRARVVLAALIKRGVNPAELSSIAIGKRQPIADNHFDEGRARNRRVEFMISASQVANARLVQERIVFQQYMDSKPPAPVDSQRSDVARSRPISVSVITPSDFRIGPANPDGVDPQLPVDVNGSAQPNGVNGAQQPAVIQTAEVPKVINLEPPVVASAVDLVKPNAIERAPLNNEFHLSP